VGTRLPVIVLLATAAPLAAAQTLVERGQYLAAAGGCVTCHTADAPGAVELAGGRALESPFGTFYSPNITPDPDTGIGAWSEDEFVNAFWEGVGPGGRYYFPAFPYTAYTGLSRDDLLAIRAYLFSLEPVHQPARAHDLPWYLDTRLAAAAWQTLKFDAGRFAPSADRDAEWNRGAYLVRHLGHCGECHTPRDSLGGLRPGRELAGTPGGLQGKPIPNITPHPKDGIGGWSAEDLVFFLEIGMLPDGDFVGGSMAPVIDDNTSRLTPEDRRAIAVYLQSTSPLADEAGS
jgi:mono/diheme cytochrome c family protein